MTAQDKTEPEAAPIAASAAANRRLRILFTEGGSLSARQTLYPLGGRYEIDLIDPDSLCQCRFSSFVRRFFRSPAFSREPLAFLRFLLKLDAERSYDVFLPTHEQVYLLSRFREPLSQRAGLALPSFAALERMQNKAEFSRLLIELNLPQPETVSVRTRAELGRSWQFPLYLKLPHSTAGGGVFYVVGQTELEQRFDDLVARRIIDGQFEVLLQQPGRGVLSTVQTVFNRGELIGVHTFEARRLGVGGMSTARVSVDHAIVRDHVARTGRHLEWHGAFFIDYFYDRASGQPQYIECNPRIGETVNAMLSGVNLPELLVRVSRGESPPPQPPGRPGVLTHNIIMILMSAAYEGQSRSAILRELRDFATGRGLYAGGEDELVRPRADLLSILPFIWTTLQLLVWPQVSRRIVENTVANYAVPEAATQRIKELPLDALDGEI